MIREPGSTRRVRPMSSVPPANRSSSSNPDTPSAEATSSASPLTPATSSCIRPRTVTRTDEVLGCARSSVPLSSYRLPSSARCTTVDVTAPPDARQVGYSLTKIGYVR